jgi:hypothetical protein
MPFGFKKYQYVLCLAIQGICPYLSLWGGIIYALWLQKISIRHMSRDKGYLSLFVSLGDFFAAVRFPFRAAVTYL